MPDATAARLADLYRGIAERSMRDLPIYNPALGVAALGFQLWDGAIWGALVTPWFLNLVRVGPAGTAMPAIGSKTLHALPAGTMEFVVGDLEGFGPLESCSLFSPMFEFADQAAAEATALAAMVAIFDPEYEKRLAAQTPKKIVDRRAFLRGRTAG